MIGAEEVSMDIYLRHLAVEGSKERRYYLEGDERFWSFL